MLVLFLRSVATSEVLLGSNVTREQSTKQLLHHTKKSGGDVRLSSHIFCPVQCYSYQRVILTRRYRVKYSKYIKIYYFYI